MQKNIIFITRYPVAQNQVATKIRRCESKTTNKWFSKCWDWNIESKIFFRTHQFEQFLDQHRLPYSEQPQDGDESHLWNHRKQRGTTAIGDSWWPFKKPNKRAPQATQPIIISRSSLARESKKWERGGKRTREWQHKFRGEREGLDSIFKKTRADVANLILPRTRR